MWPAFSVRTPNCLSTNGLVQVIRSVTAFPSTFDRPIFAGSRFADFGNRQRQQLNLGRQLASSGDPNVSQQKPVRDEMRWEKLSKCVRACLFVITLSLSHSVTDTDVKHKNNGHIRCFRHACQTFYTCYRVFRHQQIRKSNEFDFFRNFSPQAHFCFLFSILAYCPDLIRAEGLDANE